MSEKIRSLKLREPNSLIEAKTKMSREEIVLWLYSLLRVKAVDLSGKEEDVGKLKESKKPFKAIAKVNLKDLAKYSVKDGNSKRVYDLFRYYLKTLDKLIQKTAFQVDKESYKQALEYYGFDYLIEFYNLNNEKLKALAIAVIEKIELWEDGVIVYFTEYVAPFIVEFRKWFTTYNLSEIIELKSRTALILYRIFRKYLGLKRNKFEISTEKLKEILATSMQGKDLKSKLLEPAIEEINNKTSLRVNVRPIRKGRGGRIVGFEFQVEELSPSKISIERILKDPQYLNEWLNKVLEELSQDLETTKKELAEFLLSLRRIKTATALWFLLHFPKGARAYALRHLEITDNSPDIKFPDKFLEKLLIEKKEELNFLKDERIEPLLNKALEEMLKEKEVKENSQPQTSETLEEEDEELKKMLGL